MEPYNKLYRVIQSIYNNGPKVSRSIVIMILIFITILSEINAQESVLKFLEGERVGSKESVFLSLGFEGKDTVMNYFVGKEHYTDIDKVDGDLKFLVENGTAVYLEWLNPLKYSINIESTIQDAEIDKGLESFTEKLTGPLSLEQIQEKQSEMLDQLFRAPALTREGLKAEVSNLTVYEDLQLSTWIQLARLKQAEFINVSTLDDLSNQLKKLEDSIRVDLKSELEEVLEGLQKISNPDHIANEERAYKEGQGFVSEIGKRVQDLNDQIDYLKNLDYEKLFKSDSESGELVIYSKGTIFGFIQKVSQKIEEFKSAQERLSDLLGRLSDSQEKIEVEVGGKHYFRLTPSVKIPRGQEATMNITIKTVTSDQTQSKEVLNKNLVFGRFKKFIPFVSSGVFYSSLQISSFETGADEQGETVVQEVSEARKPVYALMLNYIAYVRNSDVLPFIQLGVDPTKERPFLLFGAGLSFPKVGFALSGGLAWTWEKSLSGINLGDSVSGTAEIREMTQFDFSPEPKIYFGIQIGF